MGMPQHVSGSNFLVLSVNLIPVPLSLLPVHAPTTFSHYVNSPLSPSITPSLFCSRLKIYLFHKPSHHGLHSGLRTDSMDFITDRNAPRFFKVFFQYSFSFGSVQKIKLAIRQLLGARKYSASYHIIISYKSVIFNLATDSGHYLKKLKCSDGRCYVTCNIWAVNSQKNH